MIKGTVLVIEDDSDSRRVLEILMSKHGWDVCTASSGEEGLAKAQGDPPGVILLDISLPGMDGWEVLRLLKMSDETSGIPVIVVTARTEPRDRIRGLQEGAVDYVLKPFENRDLLAKVETAFDPAVPGSGGVADR